MTSAHDRTDRDAARRERLLALLHDGDIDAALQAGLMAHASTAAGDAPIREAQARLREAWAARDRFRAREARLAERAAGRTARRAAARPPAATAPEAPAVDAPRATPARPALPAAAAAALARAQARAAGRKPG